MSWFQKVYFQLRSFWLHSEVSFLVQTMKTQEEQKSSNFKNPKVEIPNIQIKP